MPFDTDAKTLAVQILQKYEAVWSENTALRLILETYPMPDGGLGLPRWREMVAAWRSNSEAQELVRERFAEIYSRLEDPLDASTALHLLLEVPHEAADV